MACLLTYVEDRYIVNLFFLIFHEFTSTFLVHICNGVYKPVHTHTHPFNGPLSGTTQVGQYQKGKTNLDFTEARDNEWQWHQLGHMQVCTSLQAGNHASTPLLSFLQAGCPSCHPTNSVKALRARVYRPVQNINLVVVTVTLGK